MPDIKQQAIERLQSLGAALQKKIDDRVARRSEIEERWLKDLRQYHGKIDPGEDSRLKEAKKSRIVVNITRAKCNTAESRLVDLLFPSDDRNWGLRPTPVPELAKMSHSEEMVPVGDGQQPARLVARELLRRAKEKAKEMEREIDDQLTEAEFAAKSRDMIHDAVVLGTGVIKAPVVVGRARKTWTAEGGVQVLTVKEDDRPGAERVSPWDFFPDPNARSMDEAEDVFERRSVNAQQLRQLAKQPDIYFSDQIRELLTAGPTGSSWGKLDQIREITGTGRIDRDNFFELWEYHGTLEHEELLAAGLPEELLPDDILHELSAVVVFCQGRVLRVSLNPMETGEQPYSVFCWEDDDSSIFGFGVPYRMRGPQKVMNASWRMLMDNAAISVGPQLVMNKEFVVPADGDWTVTGRKLWYLIDRTRSVRDVFASHRIENNQADLMAIFQQARKLADEETNLPLISQGDQHSGITKTASGMHLLMASADVVLRRTVRSYDDNITVPVIRRFYDWNMEHSDKEEIKGDYEVDARGSAALMEAAAMEQGIQELSAMATHPVFGPMTNGEEMYRRVCKARKIDPDGLLIPEEEREPAGPPPELELKQAEIQLRQAELQLKQEEAGQRLRLQELEILHRQNIEEAKLALDYEVQLAKVAEHEGVTMAALRERHDIEIRRQELETRKDDTRRQIAALQAQLRGNELMAKL